MGQTLTEIAQKLKGSNKKVQLIYAFNGVGKTRLSIEFKNIISQQIESLEDEEHSLNILYYNAFTEDLFYWDNDLENDLERKLKIHSNSFTKWLLYDEGKDKDVYNYFSYYTNTKTSLNFNDSFSEITFSTKDDNGTDIENIKISKGEESCLIWSIFYTMLELVIDELNTAQENRSTSRFDKLEYVFIDDPVTSLDENHLIKLAVDLAFQIKTAPDNLKFIITTHNPLFYNVLCNECNKPKRYILRKLEDREYCLERQSNDSPFSYHLFLLSEIKKAIDSNSLQKYHFNMFRNVLEKTSTFLGVPNWGNLLNDETEKKYVSRLINISSHSKISSLESCDITDEDKETLKNLMKTMIETYHFNLQ